MKGESSFLVFTLSLGLNAFNQEYLHISLRENSLLRLFSDWCLHVVLQAEKKHKSFQELDRFMHYYTRFKNHEHSYQVNSCGFVLQWLFCIVLR